MMTILCYAFARPEGGTLWDLDSCLAKAEIPYMHSCVDRLIYVRIAHAKIAQAALAAAGLPTDGRITDVPEADWPSVAETGDPVDPDDIDWDPRETWCAGAPPRLAL